MHPASRFRAKLFVIQLCVFSLLSVQLTPAVHAQAYTPPVSYNSACVFIEGKAMYIQSGMTIAGRTQQAFSIDLSKPWNVTSPLYTKMKDGILGESMPNTLLADGESWFLVFNSTHAATYNVQTGAIATRINTFVFNTNPGLSGVTDPDTNTVIIPNGVGGATGLPTALVNGISTQYFITPSYPEMASYGYSMAWSKSAKTAFVIGGTSGTTPSTFFGRWSSVNNAWERISSPQDPAPRDMACMVPAYNGTKLVLFGGRTSSAPLGDIWVYDVLLSTWKQGSPGGPSRTRSAHACAVSGDYVIAWGGLRGTIDTPSDYTSLYNLRTNTWVDQYVPLVPQTTTTTASTKSTTPISSGTSSSTTPNPSSEPTSQPSPSSFIRIGIPIIAVVAVAIVAGLLFLFYRRKKAKDAKRSAFIIPLDHNKNAGSLPFPSDETGSHHFQKTALYDDAKRQPQQHQQYPAPYTAAHLNEHSPGSTHRRPQGNEMQAQEMLLQEYENRWQRHLEEQRELEQRIEQQRADLQMMKGGGQAQWDRPMPQYAPQSDRRGPQYWSVGSSGDKELPNNGWTEPQQPRGVQAYYPSRQF